MTRSKPLIIGHRGHEFGPENTIETFKEAIRGGAEMIELDVWLSGDGVPVVYHDEFLISGGEEVGRVAQYSVADLVGLELPNGARIPTLERVLVDILPRVPLNVELKFFTLHYRPLVEAVIEVVRRVKAEESILVSSFFHQALEVVNWTEPKIATAPIFGVPTGAPHPQDLEKLKRLKAWQSETGLQQPAAVVDYLMLDERLVTEFKSANLALVAYTVDEPEDMRRMAKLGVDGIITKRPNLLKSVLQEGC